MHQFHSTIYAGGCYQQTTTPDRDATTVKQKTVNDVIASIKKY